MQIPLKLGAAFLALAALATACTSVASQPGRGGKVYLVGIASAG